MKFLMILLSLFMLVSCGKSDSKKKSQSAFENAYSQMKTQFLSSGLDIIDMEGVVIISCADNYRTSNQQRINSLNSLVLFIQQNHIELFEFENGTILRPAQFYNLIAGAINTLQYSYAQTCPSSQLAGVQQ